MPTPSVPVAPAATLTARRIGHEHAGRVVLERRLSLGQPGHLSRSRRAQWGREVHPAPDPRGSHRAHSGSGPGRPAHGDDRISVTGAHPRARRNGARHVATTHRSRRRRGRAGSGSVAARQRSDRMPRTATRFALARYESLAAGDFEARLTTTLDQVGLPPASADLPTAALSGGQRARAALAAVLLARFDITLLDEPTNDLDFDGLARLEDMVAHRRGGLVLVSHDRAFLDGSVTDVMELDQHSRTGHVHGGGWSGYQAERAAERSHAEEAYAQNQAQRAQLRSRAQRERQWATTGVSRERRQPRDNDKAQRDFRINRTEKLAARARRSNVHSRRSRSWRSPGRGGTCGSASMKPVAPDPWSPGSRTSWCDGESSPWARSPSTSAGRSEWRSSARTDRARRPWSRRCSVVCRWRRGPGGSVRVSLWASWPRTAVCSARPRPSSRPSRWRQDSPRGRPGRSWQSSASTRTPPLVLRPHSRRANAPGRSWPRLPPGASTSWCSTSPRTISTLPAIEQLEEALRSYHGTLLLVSHDRRLLEAVEITRRVLLPSRDQEFRGLVEEHER